MANGVKCRAETQEDERCDVALVHVEEDVIGYFQERSDVYDKQTASWGRDYVIKLFSNFREEC